MLDLCCLFFQISLLGQSAAKCKVRMCTYSFHGEQPTPNGLTLTRLPNNTNNSFNCHFVSIFFRYLKNRLNFGMRNFFRSCEKLGHRYSTTVGISYESHGFPTKNRHQGHFYENDTLAPLALPVKRQQGQLTPHALLSGVPASKRCIKPVFTFKFR